MTFSFKSEVLWCTARYMTVKTPTDFWQEMYQWMFIWVNSVFTRGPYVFQWKGSLNQLDKGIFLSKVKNYQESSIFLHAFYTSVTISQSHWEVAYNSICIQLINKWQSHFQEKSSHVLCLNKCCFLFFLFRNYIGIWKEKTV